MKYKKLSSIIWPAVKSLKKKPGAEAISYKASISEDWRESFETEISVFRDFFDCSSHQSTPAAWFYIPAQQAQLSLLLSESFPLPAPGLIHAENKIAVHENFDVSHGFTTETSVKIEERKNNALAAIFEVKFYQNEICKAACRSVDVWLNRTKPSSNEKKTTEEKKQYTHKSGIWSLPDFLGRQYAKVSGDYNPIHLHPILAQAFGFRGTVLHGWCSASKVAAFIEKETGETIKQLEVKFVKPVIIPCAVVCQYSFTTENEVEFCLCSDDEEVVYLIGKAFL